MVDDDVPPGGALDAGGQLLLRGRRGLAGKVGRREASLRRRSERRTAGKRKQREGQEEGGPAGRLRSHLTGRVGLAAGSVAIIRPFKTGREDTCAGDAGGKARREAPFLAPAVVREGER